MRDLLLVIFFIITVYFTFKRPFLGVCAWVWIALTAPTLWAFGFSTALRLNFTIVIVTFLAYLFVEKNKQFKLGAIGWLVILFCLWTLVSSLSHITVNSEEIWQHFSDFLKVVALFFFTVLLIKKRFQIDAFIWCLVLSISSYAAMEAFKFVISAGGHEVVGRAGVIQDRNDFAVAINMCIPLMAYLYFTSKEKLIRLGLLGLIALNVIAVIGTYSRGGFIGLSILAIAFWWRSSYKVSLAVLMLILLPVLYTNAPQDWKERQSTVATAATEDGSFIGRLWAWKISTMIALDNPLTGGGFRAVTDPIVWHSYAPYTSQFGPIVTPSIPQDLLPKAAHNIYFQVLGDHGFIGLFLFLGILFKAYRNNIKTRKIAHQNNQDWLVKLTDALNLSLIGYCVTGANVSLAYFDLTFAVLAIITVTSLQRENLNSLGKLHNVRK